MIKIAIKWLQKSIRSTLSPIGLASLTILCAIVLRSSAQSVDPSASLQPLPNTSQLGDSIESINGSTGALHIEIPFTYTNFRGKTITQKFVYNTPSFYAGFIPSTQPQEGDRPNPGNWLIHTPQALDWQEVPSVGGWYLTYDPAAPNNTSPACPGPPSYGEACGPTFEAKNFAAVDPQGQSHPLALDWYAVLYSYSGSSVFAYYIDPAFAPPHRLPYSTSGWALDGSGVFVDLGAGTIRTKDGAVVSRGQPWTVAQGNILSSDISMNQIWDGGYEDPNGNQLPSSPSCPNATSNNSSTSAIYGICDAEGNTQSINIQKEFIVVQTNDCPTIIHYINAPGPCTDISIGRQVISSITLPNGNSYKFNYASNSHGELISLTLPTGTTISYTYAPQIVISSNNVSSAAGAAGTPIYYHPTISQKMVTTNGVTTTWNYTAITSTREIQSFTAEDPLGNCETHSTAWIGPNQPEETGISWYPCNNTTGTPQKSVVNGYAYEKLSFLDAEPSQAINIRLASVTTTLDGVSSQIQTDYETIPGSINTIFRGNPTEVREYDFGASTPTRVTDYTYLHQVGNSTATANQYTALNITGLVATKIISGVSPTTGAFTPTAQTNYEYDNYTVPILMEFQAAFHDDANFGVNNLIRGNLTAISSWNNVDGSWPATRYEYDDLGNRISITDANAHTASSSYTDNFTDQACVPAGQMLYTAPTSSTNAMGQISSYKYSSCLGIVTQIQDPNDVAQGRQGTVLTYDSVNNLVRTTLPDGGIETVNYGGYAVPLTITSSTYPNGSTSVSNTTVLDGLGRKYQIINADSSTSETIYDADGHISYVTNPHTMAPSSSDGATSYSYDYLGRPSMVCNPDNGTAPGACAPGASYQSYSYTGNTSTVTDEAGNSSKKTWDAFGRLIAVTEPNSAVTSYTYDVNNNLTSVTQPGLGNEVARKRTFTYDSLSRLICSANPETNQSSGSQPVCPSTPSAPMPLGSTIYTYDLNSNVKTKTDASGAQMQYTYDALNRMINKYSPNDPQTTNSILTYDQGSNGIGRMYSELTPGVTGTNFIYDPMGRVTGTSWYNFATSTWQAGIGVRYDLAGNITRLTYPDQRVVTQAFDSAGRLASVADFTGGVAGASYLSGAQYYPSGALQADTLGNGVTENFMLNNRLQLCRSLASTTALTAKAGGGANLYDRQSFYNPSISSPCGNEANNNGNVYAIIDNLVPGNAQGFHYDGMNRLTSASNSNGTYNHTYNYDSFGNMLLQDNLHANLAYSIDPYTSRLLLNNTDFVYSPNGNLVSSPGMSYLYMPEGYLRCINNCSVGSYLTDGLGERTLAVHNNNSWNEYVYLNGQPVADLDSNGTWTDYISANGQKIAKVQSQNSIFHLTGSVVAGTGAVSTGVQFSGLNGMTIQPGDTLRLWQYTIPENGAAGGILLSFADGTYSSGSGAWTDAEGQEGNEDGVQGQWHQRTLDMSQFQGRTVSDFIALSERTGSVGQYDYYFADISVHRADGTIVPVWIGMPSPSGLSGTVFGPGTATATVDNSQPAANNTAQSTHFYLNDHLGTTQIELSAGGWPIWQGAFTPFGQEIIGGSTTNYIGQQPADGTSMRYKFTGKERDTESGLDYFGARYYGSSMGRYMSPDWSNAGDPVPWANLEDPQTLNLYAYVQNNPLSRRDRSGHATDPCNGNNDTCVTVTAKPDPPVQTVPFFAFAIGLGHHFIPRQLIKTWDPKSFAARLANQLTTGTLKDKTANYNDLLQRSNNSKVIKIVRDYMQANGKNAGDLVKADFDAIVEKISTAGGDIEAFNDRLQATNPGVRTVEDALGHAAQLVGAGVEDVEEACGGTCPIP